MPPRPAVAPGPEDSWHLDGLDADQSSAPATSENTVFPDSSAQLDSLNADFLDWSLPASGEELDITELSGQALEFDRGVPSDYHLTAESVAQAWADNAQSQAFLNQLRASAESLEVASTNRRGAREDFSNPVSVAASQQARSQFVATAPAVSSPAQSSISNTPSKDTPEIHIPEGISRQPAVASSSPGAAAPRSTTKRVQFQEMTSSSQQWTRSDDERSSVPSASPAAEMMKADPTSRDQGQPHRPESNGPKTSILRARQVDAFSDTKGSLPAEKGFPIQIGSELFRLSGASIMSDAPSYFSRFFEEQMRSTDDNSGNVKTLYIDRDPITFQDIALHLQGYRVLPRDGYHFVKLFADAQFYGLPKLIKQLFESEYFIRIGEKDFRISKDVFSSPGNMPNFFSLGFAIFAPSGGDVFPGLPHEGLFRPPSIEAPSLLNRSASTFADILHLLRGYPLQIQSPEHRTELLRDCRYYHLRGLEQQLIQHSISFNVARQKSEMVIRLEDIRQSGVSFAGDVKPSDVSPLAGWVNYARPFVDETSYELILELGDEHTRISLRTMRAEFFGQAKARITSLFQVVANKMNLPTNVPLGLMMSTGGVAAQPVSPGNTPLSEDLVKVAIERDAHVVLDGDDYSTTDLPAPVAPVGDDTDMSSAHSGEGGSVHLHPMSRSPSIPHPPRKRARRGSMDDFGEWVILKGQWRLRVQPRAEKDVDNGPAMEIVMIAVKLDAVSGQRGRNATRAFLN